MRAPSTLADSEGDDLLAVVSDIRARNTNADLPVPASEAVAAVLVHLRDEEPMDPAELAEHECQWRAAQDEFLAVERADARQDQLL